jgi:ribosomal protein S12 methylthiotransferase accessory factor
MGDPLPPVRFYDLGRDAIGAALSDSPELERLAQRFKRLFGLQSPFAPGFAFVGGEIEPKAAGPGFAGHGIASIAGPGASVPEAFASCIGEAGEFLSQFEQRADVLARGTLAEVETRTTRLVSEWSRLHLDDAQPEAEIRLDWVGARRLADGLPVLLPADLCLRRLPRAGALRPRSALSTGCAAGATVDDATLRALLELIERDAASLWWIGGRHPRPVCLEDPAAQTAKALLDGLRQGRDMRRTWLVDITTEFKIPCLAALSVDPDGRGFACGLAARMTAAAAARSAILEMCQMELALALVATKLRERGDAALSAVDRRHAERGLTISADGCRLLHPQGIPVLSTDMECLSTADLLTGVVERLGRFGIDAYAVDLTRKQFGIAVARVVAPALQLFPSELIGPRLVQSITETGGGMSHTKGISLL